MSYFVRTGVRMLVIVFVLVATWLGAVGPTRAAVFDPGRIGDRADDCC